MNINVDSGRHYHLRHRHLDPVSTITTIATPLRTNDNDNYHLHFDQPHRRPLPLHHRHRHHHIDFDLDHRYQRCA